MEEKAIIANNFISANTAQRFAKRMKRYYDMDIYVDDDRQAPNSFSWYCLNYDLLEDCTEQMCKMTGKNLEPAYDYCRIYTKGEVLKPHKDRPSCEFSVTVNLKNVGDGWEFHWTGGSTLMQPGDAVIYRGCDLEHWRGINPSEYVYQAFLHYVDMDGPYAENAYEYLRRRPSHVSMMLDKSK